MLLQIHLIRQITGRLPVVARLDRASTSIRSDRSGTQAPPDIAWTIPPIRTMQKWTFVANGATQAPPNIQATLRQTPDCPIILRLDVSSDLILKQQEDAKLATRSLACRSQLFLQWPMHDSQSLQRGPVVVAFWNTNGRSILKFRHDGVSYFSVFTPSWHGATRGKIQLVYSTPILWLRKSFQ
jgi:hypothetical protein